MAIYDNILKALKEKNLNAKRLSEMTGISQGNISDWKYGKKEPSQQALIKISDALDVSVDYLLGKKNKPINEDELTEDERIMLELFAKLSDKNRSLVLELAENLKPEK